MIVHRSLKMMMSLLQEDYYATHQCFLSKRSLYLVLWNVNDGDDGINELESWLRNIQVDEFRP